MTNQTKFRLALQCAYTDLFASSPEYAFSAAKTTPEALAAKMTAGLANGSANKDGDGIKRACKACGIKPTYKAIRAYLEADDKQIEALYYKRCTGVAINILDIPKVFAAGRAAIDAGQDAEAAIVDYVETIRRN